MDNKSGAAMWKSLIVKKIDNILLAIIELPKTKNAISYELISDICLLKDSINQDDSISVVVLTGSHGAFCSGGNIKEICDTSTGMFSGDVTILSEKYRHGIQQIPLSLYEIDVPIIAAVNGAAIGAGLDLALMCDMRVCSENAFFAESFTRIGLISGDGGYWFLPRIVGIGRAIELALSGRTITAREAESYGIVLDVWPENELLTHTMDLASTVAANARKALISTKKLLRESLSISLSQHLSNVAVVQAALHHTREHRTAIERLIKNGGKAANL
jgi:enoyl-CoA hydratase/carnithine racemase